MIRSLGKRRPAVEKTAFVHDSAEVIGAVRLGAGSSVWPMAVLRGDVNGIIVGPRTNIQDMSVVHCRREAPTVIGGGVTVGHNVIIHGARIGDGCLLGMGAIIMESVIGAECLVAAGAMVPAGLRIPARSLVLGFPAKVVRPLRPAELRRLKSSAAGYVRLAAEHRRGSRVIF
jgi:carbonic anhydrase/acetyltransferase-like protein (isoleucine patch superfamily)